VNEVREDELLKLCVFPHKQRFGDFFKAPDTPPRSSTDNKKARRKPAGLIEIHEFFSLDADSADPNSCIAE
jgi:hypothetical protein